MGANNALRQCDSKEEAAVVVASPCSYRLWGAPTACGRARFRPSVGAGARRRRAGLCTPRVSTALAKMRRRGDAALPEARVTSRRTLPRSLGGTAARQGQCSARSRRPKQPRARWPPSRSLPSIGRALSRWCRAHSRQRQSRSPRDEGSASGSKIANRDSAAAVIRSMPMQRYAIACSTLTTEQIRGARAFAQQESSRATRPGECLATDAGASAAEADACFSRLAARYGTPPMRRERARRRSALGGLAAVSGVGGESADEVRGRCAGRWRQGSWGRGVRGRCG
jgi:hypothetical protein